jgi:predicted RNA-binding protein YlxR (DUF448 family)
MTVDPSGRLAGRGAYLCRRDDCTRVGLERALQRALATPVPDELAPELTNMITTEGGARGQE